MSTAINFLENVKALFRYYKSLGDKSLEQCDDLAIHHKFHPASNSIATIVKHMHGNMLSRWTDFLHSDGEKPWREREREFEDDIQRLEDLTGKWEEGWTCLFSTLDTLTASDLSKIVYIRNEGHTVMEAIQRQLAHYSYHVGQIVLIAKACNGENWTSLSISRGQSDAFNLEKFSHQKKKKNFI